MRIIFGLCSTKDLIYLFPPSLFRTCVSVLLSVILGLYYHLYPGSVVVQLAKNFQERRA